MPIFEAIEPKAYHCGQMARIVRKEQAIGMIELGANPHRQLKMCFEGSPMRWAYARDGRLVGLGGIMSTLASAHGHLWMAVSNSAIDRPVAMIKEIRKLLREILAVKREIFTIVIKSDPASVRFAEFFGFKPIEDLDGGIMIMRVTREE